MERLKIAIQKSGRLNDDSLKILKECGIHVVDSPADIGSKMAELIK